MTICSSLFLSVVEGRAYLGCMDSMVLGFETSHRRQGMALNELEREEVNIACFT